MKKLIGVVLALYASIALSATQLPIQLLNPAGSTPGQAIVSTGTSTALAWGNIFSGATIYDAVAGYGADPTGVADSTTPIQNATNACQSGGGGIIWIKNGNYKIAGTITETGTSSCAFQGATSSNGSSGTSGTRLISSSATLDILDLESNAGAFVSDIAFDSSVTRTSGNFLLLFTNNGNNLIRNVAFTNYFLGISMQWNNGTLDHAVFAKPVAATGIGISVSGNAGCDVLHDVEMFPPGAGVQPLYGILVQNSGCLQISDSDIIQQGTDLGMIAGTGQTIGATYVSNTFFDTAVNGIRMVTTGTGNIVRAVFTNTWASSHSNSGVIIQNGGTGTVSGIQFVNHIGVNNTGSGITLNGGTGNATDIGISDSLFGGNGVDGITVGNNSSTVTLTSNRTGAYGGVAGNTGCGIKVGTGVTSYNIVGNQTTGNTGGTICDSSNAGMTIVPQSGGGTILGTGSSLTASPTAGDSTSKIATTFFVQSALAAPTTPYGSVTPASVAATTLSASGNDAIFYQTTNAQSFTSGTPATVTTWTKVFDRVNANFNASTGTFTAPVTGIYHVAAQLTFSANTGAIATVGQVFIVANGVQVAANNFVRQTTTSTVMNCLATADVSLTAGQTIVIQGSQNTGGAVTLNGNSLANYLSIDRIP